MCNVIPRTNAGSFVRQEPSGEIGGYSITIARNLTSIFSVQPIMKQTHHERETTVCDKLNEQTWNQQRNGARGAGRGREEFSFRRWPSRLRNSRKRKWKGDEKRAIRREVPGLGVPSGLDISNFTWNETKKWRANSHNKADNRAIKITFARPKKAKRPDQQKTKREFRVWSPAFSSPTLPPAAGFGGRAAAAASCVLKNFLRKELTRPGCSPREKRVTRHRWTAFLSLSLSRVPPSPSARYLFPSTPSKHERTFPPNHTFSKHDCVHIHGEEPCTR